VEAIDGGIPARTGFVDIRINVIDVNDNSPVFEHDVYETTISENIQVGTTVLTVHATDRDGAGPNSHVVYDFSSLTATSYGQLFGINNVTGEIYIAGNRPPPHPPPSPSPPPPLKNVVHPPLSTLSTRSS